MLTRDELKNIVLKNQAELGKNLGLDRDYSIKMLKNFATIISGIRRCGKSTLAKQFLKSRKPVYYLYFEDVALAEFKTKDFVKLDEVFHEVLGDNGIYFFDEIQNVKGWEIFVRRLVDKNKEVLITGSNASMLSRELGTRLTGRHISYELFPFSFNEFLRFKNKEANVKNFEEYLELGGFPEYLKTNDKVILRNLFQDIFYRDILVRNNIRNEADLKSLLAYLSSNIGKKFSYTKLRDSLGIKSVHTIKQFISACENAYLFFTITKYDYSVKKQLINPKKIYCIDNALIKLNSFSVSSNSGQLLENLVFLELRKKQKEIYYHSEKKECDFVIKEGNRITQAIQVCYLLNDENKQREINGLLEAMDAYKLKEGLLLTNNQEDVLELNNKKIILKPVWKWLTNN
ncbi:MAG: Archaeal ATPase [archaeon ADurb.Bin336]|nr:MAG: Archaeal ATPase [archaeon ADurb.Bin336]